VGDQYNLRNSFLNDYRIGYRENLRLTFAQRDVIPAVSPCGTAENNSPKKWERYSREDKNKREDHRDTVGVANPREKLASAPQ